LFRHRPFEARLRQDGIPLKLAAKLLAAVYQVGIELVLEIVLPAGPSRALVLMAALHPSNIDQMSKVNFQPPGPHQLRPDELGIQVLNNRVGPPPVPGETERQQDYERNAEPPAAFSLEVRLSQHTLNGPVRHALDCMAGCENR